MTLKKKVNSSNIDIAGIMKICSDIESKEGAGSIFSLGSNGANKRVKRWSTGLNDLDYIIGGGMPEGRIIEIYGAESSGKTSLAYHLCAQHKICIHIPIEGTFEKERAKLFGNRPKQMLVYNSCKYGEQALNKMILLAEKGIPLEVLDSVPSLQPREDVEKIRKAVHNNAETELRIGGIATLMTKYLPVLEDVIEQTGTTVIFINQIRDKMNAMPFGDNIQTSGGHKLKHACSLRIQCARKGWIEIPNNNPYNSASKEKIGMIMKCKVVKSKICNPMGECEIPLFFEKGFVDFAELSDVRKEIMEKHREVYKNM